MNQGRRDGGGLMPTPEIREGNPPHRNPLNPVQDFIYIMHYFSENMLNLSTAIVRCLEDMQVDSNASTARNATMLLNSLKPCSIIIRLVVAQHISSILLPLTTLNLAAKQVH